MTAALPPDPFEPAEEIVAAGHLAYRVGNDTRPVSSFNPGVGRPTRFAFFATPPVAVLYAADTDEAALAESLLHDIPVAGGYLGSDDYANKVMGRLVLTRDVRLASLRALGLRKLGAEPTEVTDTPATEDSITVRWAEAAHAAGFDGLAWTSRLCNDARAMVLFGDWAADAVEQDPTFGRHFRSGDGLDWLITVCAPLRVHVLPPH